MPGEPKGTGPARRDQAPGRVLVISPHPDDEAIGCGGTIRKHVRRGDEVRVIFLTSGEAGGHGRSPEDTRRLREIEAHDAALLLGLKAIEFWRQPDKHLRATREILARLRRAVLEFRPSLMYVTHQREMHSDHQAAFRIVERTVAGLGEKKPAVLLYEVWTSLQDIHRVEDISDVMEEKLAAVRAYRTQCAAMRFDGRRAGPQPISGRDAELARRTVRRDFQEAAPVIGHVSANPRNIGVGLLMDSGVPFSLGSGHVPVVVLEVGHYNLKRVGARSDIALIEIAG